MADILQLIEMVLTLTGPGNVSANVFLQDITEGVEVSAYDQSDAQVFVYALESGGSVKVTLLTSMLRDEKLDGWEVLGEVSLALATGGAPSHKSVTFPAPILATTTDAPVPLLRYLRWMIEFTGGATRASVRLLGMLRRRGD